jgi:hypothetical protein
LSENWVKDIHEMHAHYGIDEAMKKLSIDKLRKYLKFRANFVGEEYKELQNNLENPEEVVDALIDICVVAIGTLDLYGVDAQKAWDAVLETNMNKKVGVKASRPNPLGLPDLIKPEGWTAPSHEGNHGVFSRFVCDCVTNDLTTFRRFYNNKGYIVNVKDHLQQAFEVCCEECGKILSAEDTLVSPKLM